MDEEEKTNSERNFIKSVLTYIPFIVTIAYVMGITDLISYYYYFDFDITSFLDFGEISMSAISDLIYIIPFGMVVIIAGIIQRYVAPIFSYWMLRIMEKPKSRTVRLSIFFTLTLILIIFLIFNLKNISKKVSSNNINLNIEGFIYLLMGGFIFLITMFTFINETAQFKYKTYKFFYVFLFVVIATFITSVMTTLTKVANMKIKHASIGSYIVTENDNLKKEINITSDSSYYFIGKTGKFVFFYDSKKKSVDVYPEKNISKYSLK